MFPETSSKIHKVRNQQPRNLLAVNGIEYVVFNRVPKVNKIEIFGEQGLLLYSFENFERPTKDPITLKTENGCRTVKYHASHK